MTSLLYVVIVAFVILVLVGLYRFTDLSAQLKLPGVYFSIRGRGSHKR